MKKIVNLLGHGLFYTLAISIESFAPFILAPFLTHYLTVYDYGIWAIFQAATAFLRPLLGLALDDFVRMRYQDHAREHMVGYLIAIIALSGLLSLFIGTLAMVFAAPLSEVLHFPGEWLWVIVICAWLYAMFYMLLAYYQFESQKSRFALIHLVQALGTLAVTVGLVMMGWGWQGAVIGKVAGLFMGAAIAWYWIATHFPESSLTYFQFSRVRELWAFGLRYLPNGMVFVVMMLISRLMLANMVGVEASSLFAVASLFPTVLIIVIQGYIFGWQPWCFQRLARRKPEDKLELLVGAGVFFALLPVGALILAWGANWLGPFVIDKNFHDAFAYVLPLCLAMAAQGYYYFAQSILQFYQRLGALSTIACICMAANAALNYVLIERMGTLGSCWALALSYSAGFLLTAAVAWVHLRKYIASFAKEGAHG
ncbi:MAG: hypothetical protein EBV03_01560 [Proteobacteria bacterium]|nr:hypothetical protein [Pseudomonadota bacterium]